MPEHFVVLRTGSQYGALAAAAPLERSQIQGGFKRRPSRTRQAIASVEMSELGQPEAFAAIQESPVFDPERPSGLRLGCARMYGPAVRRKMMLAD